MSKAPSFKPEGLSSLPVSPGPELVTVVRGLRGYDGPSHGGPGRGFHCASVGGVVPLRPRRVTTRLRRSGDVATAAAEGPGRGVGRGGPAEPGHCLGK